MSALREEEGENEGEWEEGKGEGRRKREDARREGAKRGTVD